jgi:exoribonuclease R
VSFDSWPSRSLNPLCHFVKIIGEIGNSKTEGDVILL